MQINAVFLYIFRGKRTLELVLRSAAFTNTLPVLTHLVF